MVDTLRERKTRRAREHVSAVALRLFDERGFGAVTVADIAREAEVGQSTFFGYFASKEDAALLDLHRELETFARVLEDQPADRTLADVCRASAERRIALAAQDPERVRVRLRVTAATPAIRGRAGEIRRQGERLLVAPLVARQLGARPEDPRVVLGVALFTGLSESLDELLLSAADEASMHLVVTAAADALEAALTALA